jgi:hypothetical protein
MKIATCYLREIHYKAKGKRYFALCFPNDSGGYEIRNPYFKGSFSPKDITTVFYKPFTIAFLFWSRLPAFSN